MTEKKKREKVLAEITLAHLMEFAEEIGRPMNREQAIAFLNQDGRAYAMWKQMMHAGEEYIKGTLQRQPGTTLNMPRTRSEHGRIAV